VESTSATASARSGMVQDWESLAAMVGEIVG